MAASSSSTCAIAKASFRSSATRTAPRCSRRPKACATSSACRSRAWCAAVRKAPTNADLKSGKIEVLCHELNVLNPSVTPPFQLDDDNLSETTRLTHRVLDLRRPQMQHNLRLRYRVAMEVRKYLDAQGFIDIETPMLTKSTPEGARDYLVPSRVNAGQFFALPQSPQLFKQLLMVANFDRYYQIVKCFRDEDLRADRQPEFTQIDCETSFLIGTGNPRSVRRHDPSRVQGNDRRLAGREIPGHAVFGSDAPLRFGQAGPAREARIHRPDGCGDATSTSRCSARRPTRRTAASRRFACRRAASSRAATSTATRNSCASTARRASRGSRSTKWRRAVTVCKARSSRTCTTKRSRRSSSAPARKTATSSSSRRIARRW